MFGSPFVVLHPRPRFPMNSEDLNSDEAPKPQPEKKLRQRRLPKFSSAPGKIEAVETRLALSANPGAELLVEVLGALDHDFCSPEKPSLLPEANGSAAIQPAVLTPEVSTLNTVDDAINLLDQAAGIRSQYNLTGAGQTVAVIDSGIAWDHVALGEGFGAGYRVVGGWDFAENDADPYDDAPAGFHGTHVSGIIGGNGDNQPGIAPDVDLVGLRVFSDFGKSSLDWVESALQWVYDNRDAFEHPITTVNMSLGAAFGDGFDPASQGQLEDELQLLQSSGIVVVAAAGNSFNSLAPDDLNYPASSSYAWAVASSGEDGLSSFSQRESSILAAPGERIVSTVPDHLLGRDGLVNDYYSASGTSMSAPQVAAASVLVRQALEQAGQLATPDTIHQVLMDSADHHIDSVTGQDFYAVNLSAAIASILSPVDNEGGSNNAGGNDGGGQTGGEDSSEITWHQPQNLGTVSWAETELQFADGVRLTAAQEGLFSIRATDQADANAIIRVTDANGQQLWDGQLPTNGQLDIPVDEGQQLIVHAADPADNAPVGLQFANVFNFDGEQVIIDTGSYNPDIVLDLQTGFDATIGEFQYVIGAGQVTSGTIDGGSGADRLEIQGSSATNRITLNPYADSTLSDGSVQLVLRGFEDVTFAGGGGADRAFLYDTRGDDTLTARPGYAKLEGVGFRYEISDVERSFVHATAGGQDVAFLHDSAGDDSLAVRPQFVSLRGNGFFNSANGFEKVYAYSNAGGFDQADLYDSAGNDRMSASATSALITSSGYYVQARGFDSVTGHATAGGYDTATLYSDDSGDSRWIRTRDQLTLKVADGSERTARGFESIQSFEGGVQVNVTQASWTPLSLPDALDIQNQSYAGTVNDDPQVDEIASKVKTNGIADSFLAHFQRRERQVLDDLFGELGSEDDDWQQP